jgi:hypothetical protein
MNEPAEPVASANRGLVSRAERNQLRRGLGRSQPERSVRALAIVVIDVFAQDALELAAADDEQPVEALLAQGADEALSVRVGVRGPERSPDDLNALRPEDFVKRCAELRVGSWIRKRSACSRPPTSSTRLRACRVTQPPLGLWVTPASRTRRVWNSMKNNTEKRLSDTVSTVKKSHAITPRACERKNVRHEGPDRRGAGGIRPRVSTERTDVAETHSPSLRSSPTMRR